MAGTAAATAATLVPHLVIFIARAAAAEAPDRAGDLVAALCRVLPWIYHFIASAAVTLAPGHEADIVAGLRTTIPEVGTILHQKLSAHEGKSLPLSSVLDAIDRAGLHSVKLPETEANLQLVNLGETREALQKPLKLVPETFDPRFAMPKNPYGGANFFCKIEAHQT